MEATEKKERTVIHLQIGDVHEYYGSIANTWNNIRLAAQLWFIAV